VTCRELFEFLLAYLEGEMPAEERAIFEEHLALCPPCLAYLETYQEAIELGRKVCRGEDDPPPEEVPEELVQAVLAVRRRELPS
jgi:anti-sigma factor RsiW